LIDTFVFRISIPFLWRLTSPMAKKMKAGGMTKSDAAPKVAKKSAKAPKGAPMPKGPAGKKPKGC
jgi:hypothetical protein